MHTSCRALRNPSPPFRGEREGPTPQAWEGEVGGRRPGIPHLTPTLSAPKGGEERPFPLPLQIAMKCACPSAFAGATRPTQPDRMMLQPPGSTASSISELPPIRMVHPPSAHVAAHNGRAGRLDMSQQRNSKWSRARIALAGSAAAMAAWNIYQARKAERRHPPTGRLLTIEGVRLHYLERGEGPPVVLLHGNGMTSEDFELSGVLGLAAQNHRVIAFDRPGFGYSGRPRGVVWTAARQARLLREAVAAIVLEPAVVIGHS